jgi:hypothetical protein
MTPVNCVTGVRMQGSSNAATELSTWLSPPVDNIMNVSKINEIHMINPAIASGSLHSSNPA